MKEKGLTSGQLKDLLNISYKRLEYYDKTGLIQPEISQADGRGSRRIFSRTNLKELYVLSRLLGRGVSLQKIRLALNNAVRHIKGLRKPLRDLRIFTDGNSIFGYDSKRGNIIDLINPEIPILSEAVAEMAGINSLSAKDKEERFEVLTVNDKLYYVEVIGKPGEEILMRCPNLFGISARGSSFEEAGKKLRKRIIGLNKMEGM